MTANNQTMDDFKEQMELKRLYASCDQVSDYIRISVSIKRLIETLHECQVMQTECVPVVTLRCSL